jgi:subtilisin family serine protease
LDDFVDDNTLGQVSQALGYNAAEIEAFKIFGAMTSADTLSIDRMGETIRLDDHWASFVLQLPLGSDEKTVCDRLNTLFPLVRYAHQNWVFEADDNKRPLPCPTGAANDTEYLSGQASLHPTASYPSGHINIEPAWKTQTGRNSIRVGVVDSGIDAAHPDLNNGSSFGMVVTSGYDFSNNLPRLFAQDKTGHGTACAGIIGARRNNTSGIAGIAGGHGSQFGVQLADMKIFQLSDAPISTIVRAWVEGSVQSPPSRRLHLLYQARLGGPDGQPLGTV